MSRAWRTPCSSAWSRPFSRAIGSATAALIQQLGRSPTVAELAERIGTGEDDVLKGLASARRLQHPLPRCPAGQNGEPDGPSVLGMPGAEDDALEGVENREALKPLPDRERRIFLPRFFAGMTQSQIAVEVGISQMHVSPVARPDAGQTARRLARRRGLTRRWVCRGQNDAPASQLSSHSLRQARLAVTACSALR